MAQLNKISSEWLKENRHILNVFGLERELAIPPYTLKTFYAKAGYVPEEYVEGIETGLLQFICPDKKAWKALIKKLFAEWNDAIGEAKKGLINAHYNAKHEQIIEDITHIYKAFKNSNETVAEMILAEANKCPGFYFKEITGPLKK